MAAIKRYDFSTLKVMCIDDSDFFLEVFRDVLSAFGIKRIRCCRSAQEGLGKISKFDPDMVFLDWEMREDSAEDFLREVRQNTQHPQRTVPIILLTGYTEKHRIHSARDLGINEFIVKPISARNLHARLVKMIEHPRRFYSSQTYFGPDRRRRQVEFDHEERRQKES